MSRSKRPFHPRSSTACAQPSPATGVAGPSPATTSTATGTTPSTPRASELPVRNYDYVILRRLLSERLVTPMPRSRSPSTNTSCPVCRPTRHAVLGPHRRRGLCRGTSSGVNARRVGHRAPFQGSAAGSRTTPIDVVIKLVVRLSDGAERLAAIILSISIVPPLFSERRVAKRSLRASWGTSSWPAGGPVSGRSAERVGRGAGQD
jgi:hypothetical protein